MKYTYTMSNGKELKLRLTSVDDIAIEDITGKTIQECIETGSIKTICTLLRFMVKEINGEEQKNFSLKNAQELYDELIDSGLSMNGILNDIIAETLVVSGFLEKEDWEDMKTATQASKDVKKKAVEKLMSA